MPHILLICTGNICRSPIAEALLQRRLEQEGLTDWTVESAGTWTPGGVPASLPAIQLMHARGSDLAAHRSREITLAMMEQADLILVMTQNHAESLRQEFPSQSNKIHLLNEMAEDRRRDVEDPYMRSLEVYQACINDITDLIDRGFDRIRSLAESKTV
jgi:protein-tyrosine phosphatase